MPVLIDSCIVWAGIYTSVVYLAINSLGMTLLGDGYQDSVATPGSFGFMESVFFKALPGKPDNRRNTPNILG